MIVFWILAALLASAAAVLVLWRAAAAARAPQTRPELQLYQRQLTELDELAERGLLEQEEHRSARTEAARRLLGAADAPVAASPASRPLRRTVLAAAVVAPLLGLGVYALVGTPGLSDQPYARRLAGWTATAKRTPMALSPPQMAAVLEQLAKDNPKDPTPLFFLAREQAASGQDARVLITLRDAIRRAPDRAELWIALGQAEVAQNGGQVNAAARGAFEKAQQLQPAAVEPRYFLARAQIASGDVQGGLAVWRQLLAGFPAGDPNRAALAADIAEVERTGALGSPGAEQAAAPAAGGGAPGVPADQQAFVRSMVAGLAARLRTNPDDPAGWARLIRSYRVLGDEPRRRAAASQARRLFAGRPDALKQVAAEDHPAP